MSLNQGKYKPSVCAIDEVDDRSLKHEEQLQKQQIEGSETAPLTINQQKLHIDDEKLRRQKDAEAQNDHARASAGNSSNNESVNGLRGRLSIDALMRLSRKRRILYITTACLCAVLLVIIILMIGFWPEVPFYLKAELCLEKECVEVSQQLLLWANTSKSPCHDTYEWACGNFAQEYAANDYYVIKRGEWNYKTFNEYKELSELNSFISMLPSAAVSDSVESMISSLYRSCREIDTLDKSQSDLLLKKAIQRVDGWHAFRDNSNRLQSWEYKKALVYLQVIYGIFPYYKVSVENSFNKPHGIIALDEGEVGLPDKYFYNLNQEDEIVRAYKLLLRDFAINMGIVASEAVKFADNIFHYEQRIVNYIDLARTGKEHKLNELKTLAELNSIAPSLPIADTLKAMFPQTKISEDTEVLVRDVEVIHELSNLLSSSDKKPINNFIVWSLARKLLPHLSKEYRILMENFDHSIYGHTATYPRWMICSKIVNDWLSFAVDALQQQQQQKMFFSRAATEFRRMSISSADMFPNKTYGNNEFLRLMFYNLRNQLQMAVQQADWIASPLKEHIVERLISMRLQIGIPAEALESKTSIEDYYDDLLLNNLFFVEHLESIWVFRKKRMEQKLKALNIVDTIISEMYVHDRSAELHRIGYSNILNMLLISRGIPMSSYYDYRYPVPVNFARIGVDILEVLIDALNSLVAEYNAERSIDDAAVNAEPFKLEHANLACITSEEQNQQELLQLSEHALKSFHITLSAAKIAARALSSFIKAVDGSQPMMGASIDHTLTYENLRLTKRLRMPGLRSFNENELFTLAYMQKHCSTFIADKDYARIKPHVERTLAERYLFNATWNHIQFLPRASSCSVPAVRCSNIL